MRRIGTKPSPRWRILPALATLSILSPTSSYAFEHTWNPHNLELTARTRTGSVAIPNGNDAKTSSILLRANIESQWLDNLKSVIEMDYVELFWEDEFTNGVNFNDTPVIPDTGGADLNQLFFTYELSNTLSLSLGREAYNLGNQRFVGTNGFWQNEQSFDGAGLKYEFASASHIHYQFIANANRINGDDATKELDPSDSIFAANNGLRPAKFLGDHEHESHLVFAQFREWDFSTVQAYLFDMDIKDALPLSNRTLGIRYEYKGRSGKLRTLGHAEIAIQTRPEVADSDRYSYQNFGTGIGFGSNELSINLERLGESGGVAFVTPLASLHDKNGWADKFLLTPPSGLHDYSLKYIWRNSPVKVDARYHFFKDDVNGDSYGEELDVDIEYKISKIHSILFRGADFKSKNPSFSDESRLFFMYRYNL